MVIPISGIRVHQGLIGVNVRDVLLGDLLREIERQTAVRFEVADSTYGRLVSERFSDVPMVQGIQRLLTGQDYLIDHAPPQLAHESASMLVRVLGESSGASRITQHAPMTAEDADEAAYRRAQQLSDLAASADSATIAAAVEQAIHDPHDTVRETALEVINGMMDEDAPVRLVAEVALRDDNPDLRVSALGVLGVLSDVHREVVLQSLGQAVNDRNEEVGELARDLIESLETDD